MMPLLAFFAFAMPLAFPCARAILVFFLHFLLSIILYKNNLNNIIKLTPKLILTNK